MDNKEKNQFVCPYARMQSCSAIIDDEISLLDIWNVLWGKRFLILVVTVLFTVAASIYAFVSPSVYKAEVFLLPPAESDLVWLNFFSPNEFEGHDSLLPSESRIYAEQVFTQMVRNLDSHSLRSKLRDDHPEIMGRFSVHASRKGATPRGVFVSLEGGDPAILAARVNEFVEAINDYTVSELVNAKLSARKKMIQGKIVSLQNQAKQERLDRITVLQEALEIAQKLSLVDSDLSTGNSPLYFRGVKALSVEIAVLTKRKSDDAFINGLRELQENLMELDRVTLDTFRSVAAMIDQPAMTPPQPIKPNRILIVMLGVILGMIMAFFAAFIVNFIEITRRKEFENGNIQN